LELVRLTAKRAYPPPPPPPPPRAKNFAEGFHLPGTNLFTSIRRQLSSLERTAQFKAGKGLLLGLLLSFALAGFLPAPSVFVFQYGVQPALGSNQWVSWIFLTPLNWGIFLFLGLLIVGYFVLGVIPNRRYGAVFGALAGAGHGILHIIVYAAQGLVQPAFWYLMHPIEDMVLATFLGIGAFAMVAKARDGKGLLNAVSGLPLLFFLIFMGCCFVYFGIGTLISGPNNFWVQYFALIPLVFILRDFLGGHFNFQNFLETVPEACVPQPSIPPPPPPEAR